MSFQVITAGVAALLCASGLQGASVILGGREWMQPVETVNYSYDEVAAVAHDPVTWTFSGQLSKAGLPTIDLTGWTWASGEEVAELFSLLTGAPAGTFDNPNDGTFHASPQPSAWGAASIDTDGAGPDTGYFDVTSVFASDDHAVFGLTRSLVPDGRANRSYLRAAPGVDSAVTGNPIDLDQARPTNGFWFYKVPEPSVLMLGLLGLVPLARRRRTGA